MDETGIVGAFTQDGSADLTAPNVTPSSPVPNAQPDFNQAGSTNPTGILSGAEQLITSIGGAYANITGAKTTAAVNQATAQQGAALAAQQQANAGFLSSLQNATQLALAQRAYNQAAGVTSSMGSGSLMIILTIAGVVLAAMAIKGRK